MPRCRRAAILSGVTSTTAGSFVGRAEELDRLVALLDRAERGRPAVGLIAGDAGVGKTRPRRARRRAEAAGSGCWSAAAWRSATSASPTCPSSTPSATSAPARARPRWPPRWPRPCPAWAGCCPSWPPTRAGAVARGRLRAGPAVRRGAVAAGPPVRAGPAAAGDRGPALGRPLHPRPAGLPDPDPARRPGRPGGQLPLRRAAPPPPLRPLLAELVRLPDLERIELAPSAGSSWPSTSRPSPASGPPAVVDRILARSEGNAFFAEELVAAGAIRADIALPDALADVLSAASRPARAGPGDLKVAAVPAAGSATGCWSRPPAGPRPRSSGPARRHRRAGAGGQRRHRELPVPPRSRRPSTATCCRASGPACTPPTRACWPRPTPTARTARPRRPSWPGTAWPATTSPGGLAALVRAADHAATVFAPSEAFRHLTQALELWNRVPDAAAVAGVDRVEVLVRAAEAASHSGEFRQAVGLAEEAVEAIDEDAEPLRAAMAYDRLSSYLLDAELELARVEEQMLAASRRAVELVPEQPPTPLRARVVAGLARRPDGDARLRGARRRRRGAGRGQGRRQRRRRGQGAGRRVAPGAALRRRGHGPPAAARRRPGGRRRRQPAAGAPGPPRPRRSSSTSATWPRPAPPSTRRPSWPSAAAWPGAATGSTAGCCAASPTTPPGAGTRPSGRPTADERRPGCRRPPCTSRSAGAGGRRRAAGPPRPLPAADPYVAYLAGGCEADLVRWQGDPERSSELARATLSTQEEAGAPGC